MALKGQLLASLPGRMRVGMPAASQRGCSTGGVAGAGTGGDVGIFTGQVTLYVLPTHHTARTVALDHQFLTPTILSLGLTIMAHP